ncbi:GM16012 [Drosophila sechellia]|uniref:GM16012 n=1 Tax=Drosophila sechellia TaxID=7238 RepID=B4I8M6_DROSE|nr:GM16012 [Drosophila sechellia]
MSTANMSPGGSISRKPAKQEQQMPGIQSAPNWANMGIFKTTGRSVQEDVNLLHASVLSMVEFDDDIFAAGNCFDWNEHPAQPGLFCPFAYRLPPPNLGAVFAKDLAMEYHYLGNTSEWFFLARKNAEKVIARNEQYLKYGGQIDASV